MRYRFVVEFDAETAEAAGEEAQGLDWIVFQALDHCDPAPKNVRTHLEDSDGKRIEGVQ